MRCTRQLPSGRSTPVGVAVLQNSSPCRAKSLRERRVGRRRDEQHEGRRHHVVDKTRSGYLLGPDAAADAVVALENQHLRALAGKQRRTDQRVDAAADDDVVGLMGSLRSDRLLAALR